MVYKVLTLSIPTNTNYAADDVDDRSVCATAQFDQKLPRSLQYRTLILDTPVVRL